MRKRTIECVADNLFWFLIYALPLIAFIFTFFVDLPNLPATTMPYDVASGWFDFTINNFGGGFITDNMVDFCQSYIFQDTLPNGIIAVLTVLGYYINLSIVHLGVDFLLFIPRLCSKWLQGITHTEH